MGKIKEALALYRMLWESEEGKLNDEVGITIVHYVAYILRLFNKVEESLQIIEDGLLWFPNTTLLVQEKELCSELLRYSNSR